MTRRVVPALSLFFGVIDQLFSLRLAEQRPEATAASVRTYGASLTFTRWNPRHWMDPAARRVSRDDLRSTCRRDARRAGMNLAPLT